MLRIFNAGSALLLCGLLIGGAQPQVSAEALLKDICEGNSAAAAERQLEGRGARDADIRAVLLQRLPGLLSEKKDVKSTDKKEVEAAILFAKLAGALKLVSTIPALSESLKNDGNMSISVAGLYQQAELIDDPVGAALAQIGDPSVPAVSRLLQSSDRKTRSRAVRVLSKIGTPDAHAALRAALKDEKDPLFRAFIKGSLDEDSPPTPNPQ